MVAAVPEPVPNPTIDPADLLTAKELTDRLKKPHGWVSEKRRRHVVDPLPTLYLGPHSPRYHWPSVVAWILRQKPTPRKAIRRRKKAVRG